MKNLRSWLAARRYEAIVFITGAAILVVEIAATRVLSPYYGNTIYAVSSIIGIILAALSLGYWRGGIEADRNPSAAVFYRIIFSAGASLVLLFLLVIAALPVSHKFFSVMTGPFVWSFVLFFLPSYLMGKCSPFAIVLAKAARPDDGLGQVTGSVFFWSTIGSITGSLATGFILIPHFGVRTILAATAAAVLLLGGIGLALNIEKKEKRDRLFLLFIALAVLTGLSMQKELLPEGTIFARDGLYQRLTVFDGFLATEPNAPVRLFSQDSNSSSGIYLTKSGPVFGYVKYYPLYQLGSIEPARALILGAGVYSIPQLLNIDSPETIIDVVDIEPDLDKIAERYFGFSPVPEMRTHVADGRRFLYDSQEPYDLIFSDVYSSLFSMPTHFTTREFFELAKSKLSPNGVFMANIIASARPAKDSLLLSEIRTMQSVFPNMTVFAVDDVRDNKIQNFVFIGMKDDRVITDDALAKIDSKVPFAAHRLDLAALNLPAHDMMTDDFAPIERLTADFLQ